MDAKGGGSNLVVGCGCKKSVGGGLGRQAGRRVFGMPGGALASETRLWGILPRKRAQLTAPAMTVYASARPLEILAKPGHTPD